MKEFQNMHCDLLCVIQPSGKPTLTWQALDLHKEGMFLFRPVTCEYLCLLERSYQVKLCTKVTIMLAPFESIYLGQRA